MRWRLVCGMGLLLIWMLGGASGVHAVERPQDTRARLDAGERQARLRHEQNRQVCATQFLVETCLERAREQLRVDVEAIHAERVDLDARRRQERALQRKARLDAKAARARAPEASSADGLRMKGRVAASLMAPDERQGDRAAAGPAPAGRDASSVAAAELPNDRVARAAAQSRKRERAAKAAQAHTGRASAAQAHRESVMRREAQRTRGKPAAAPLPAPAASR